MASNTGKAGVLVASNDAGSLDQLAHAVLDDVLYNIVQDLLIKTHRDEKTARATTAAIRVEKLASDASDGSTPDSKSDVRIETDAAVYEDGKVMLKGNPLKTIKDIVCPRCHLPRLLYPTDGKGAKKPDPSIIYCKKHPYIDKPGYDIYGQTWLSGAAGRSKKKKDDKANESGTATPEQRPANVLSYPSATCSKCKRCILVTRLNNHMGSCIGNSGRNASRAAAQKISNGSNGNSQNDHTPPSSQKGASRPASRASSPKKREGPDNEDDDQSDNSHKKKKIRSAVPIPKIKLKTKTTAIPPPVIKTERPKPSSSLSNEHKVDDPDTSTLPVATPKKNAKAPSPAKKAKPVAVKPPMSSPAVKAGRDADAESESSGTLSSPPQ